MQNIQLLLLLVPVLIFVLTFSLEQLYLNHNNLSCIWYPNHDTLHETLNGDECLGKSSKPFMNLHSLLLGNTINIFTVVTFLSSCCLAKALVGCFFFVHTGNNDIKDVESVDSLNYFPNLLVSSLF